MMGNTSRAACSFDGIGEQAFICADPHDLEIIIAAEATVNISGRILSSQ